MPGACLSSPCQNGGSCLELEQGYACDCQEGYGGQDCRDSEYLGSLRQRADPLGRPYRTNCPFQGGSSPGRACSGLLDGAVVPISEGGTVPGGLQLWVLNSPSWLQQGHLAALAPQYKGSSLSISCRAL